MIIIRPIQNSDYDALHRIAVESGHGFTSLPVNEELLKKRISHAEASFNSSVISGDFYEFIFIPEIGIHVLKNKELEEIIPGIDFKQAFFGVFLSDNPIQKNLKKAMLGG